MSWLLDVNFLLASRWTTHSDHAGSSLMVGIAKPSISQANINPTTFKKELIVSVPALLEQQRIANFLISLDALIAAQTQKHEALKTHKKGLMQQLFPSSEEVEA